MYTHNVLYRGLTIVVLVTLLLLAASPRGTAAPTAHPSADPNAGWQEVGAGSASGGGISDNGDDSERPSLAIAPDGTLYVAWHDYCCRGQEEIFVRRWNGSSWEEVGAGSASGGGVSDNSDRSMSPSLAIAPDGTPYVAWSDWSGEVYNEIYVRRWNGSSWEEVGTGSASGGGISNNSGNSGAPSMAIAPDGTPYVAWYDNTSGNSEIYVRRWNGSSWEEVGVGSASGGGISDNSDSSFIDSMKIAPDGTPYIAWHDYSGGNSEIYVRRWNGSSWEEVGTGSATDGGISDNDGYSGHSSLTIAPDNTPYVAWDDRSSGDEIYVRRWNGSSWEEVGAGSASGGGISDNSAASFYPSMAIAPDGTPYVAWYDHSGSGWPPEIYVRYWNGSSWGEVGAGSASGGGISDNSGYSEHPSLAIAPDGTPYVAWDDDNSGDDEIYVRRWGGGAPSPPLSNNIYLPLVMKGYCSCGPDNYEPNDSFAQAYGPLTSGQTYQSYISCCDVASRRDYFYIDISTTKAINIDLTNIPTGVDYDLYLYNSAQRRVGQSQNNGNLPDHISYDPTSAGRYYILVFSPFYHYSASPYSLRVTYD